MVKNCIMCPLGCEITYKLLKNGELTVSGNNCIRGETFIKTELTCPMRPVSTIVKCGNLVVACKTSVPVPKTKIKDVLLEASKLTFTKKPKFHTILIKKIANTEADLIVISK